MSLKYVGEITDPVHKNIKFTLIEKDIIDTFIFQRLRRIRQLAGAHLVYPGALHSRFEHSCGSMFLAGLAGQTLFEKGYINDEGVIQKLRIAALLHDIGHGPFSHLFEEVLLEHHGLSHENLGERIINETMIADIINHHGYSPKEISFLSFGKHKVGYLNEVISGGLSVDLMDYLPRDSYFSGTEYGKIDYHRIINSLEVTSRGILGINKSALYSYESMLISRYQMFKSVYFHKTVRSGEVMILNSMKIQNNILGISNFDSLDNFLSIHDEMILDKLTNRSKNSKELKEDEKLAINLAVDYRDRKLLKCIYEYFTLSNKKEYTSILDEKFSDTDEENPSKRIKVFKNLVTKLSYIIDKNQNLGEPIFLDISRAPSIPLAPKKEEVSSIMVVNRKEEFEKSFGQIPLINAITGYLDMIRIYTTKEKRNYFEKLISDFIYQDL